MNYFLGLDFLEKMYANDQILIAKVKETNVFVFVSVKYNHEKGKEYTEVIWYYNNTSEPSIKDTIPFVDVLELVDENIIQELIFNMNFFNNKGV